MGKNNGNYNDIHLIDKKGKPKGKQTVRKKNCIDCIESEIERDFGTTSEGENCDMRSI